MCAGFGLKHAFVDDNISLWKICEIEYHKVKEKTEHKSQQTWPQQDYPPQQWFNRFWANIIKFSYCTSLQSPRL
jgi:hypothetical protein